MALLLPLRKVSSEVPPEKVVPGTYLHLYCVSEINKLPPELLKFSNQDINTESVSPNAPAPSIAKSRCPARCFSTPTKLVNIEISSIDEKHTYTQLKCLIGMHTATLLPSKPFHFGGI